MIIVPVNIRHYANQPGLLRDCNLREPSFEALLNTDCSGAEYQANKSIYVRRGQLPRVKAIEWFL